MVWEARAGFVLFFFLCWAVLALIPWAIASVLTRGRGALPALPLAIGGAWAAGIVVPLLGWRDATGFLVSLGTAMIGSGAGSVAGIAFWRQVQKQRAPAEKPVLDHAIGARRPVAPDK